MLDMLQQASFYSTLTAEERARTDPCMRTRCVIMSSGDTSPPAAQASISSTGFDMVDDVRLEKKNLDKTNLEKTAAIPLTSLKPAKSGEVVDLTDPEAIEEAVPMVHETELVETQSKMKNGIDIDKRKEPFEEHEDDCLINCIYYTQECCLCTIS